MARTHRLFDLLQTLRRYRHPVSGAELARETNISLRTLYRDIATLQAMGAEIEGEAGVGYVLRPGFLLPPLMFSEEEIEALALGARWVGQRTDDALGSAARNALAKVAAVLPEDLRRRLEDEALLIAISPDQAQSIDLKLLRRALREERKLRIAYRDESGTPTERIIWPFAIGFFESVRTVGAWCELRQDFRQFRADRIAHAQLMSERYPRRRQALVKDWRKIMLTETDTSLGHNRSASKSPKR